MKEKKLAAYIAFPLLLVAIFLVTFIFRETLWSIFSSPESLRKWVAEKPLAGLVFIGIQALQVVIFIIPGEVPQVAGGYLFGFLDGILLSVAGIAIGSTVGFFLARILGIPFVRSVFKPQQIEKTEKLISSPRSTLAFFLLFLIPGIPKDILCYIAGLSSMKYWVFILISTLGRLPGIIGSVLMGNAAASRQWYFAGLIFSASVLLFFFGFLYREKFEGWIEKIASRREEAKKD